MKSKYEIKRRLKEFWREPGNPRLKGLFLAGLPNSGVRPEEVGEVWPGKKERKQQQSAGGAHRSLTAPVSQQYAPGRHHDNLDSRPESGVARTLASNEFGMQGDDKEKFLAGEESVDKDSYIKRALLHDAVTELDTLFREELEQTFIMGAQPRKIFRDAGNVTRVSGQKGDLPRESDQPYGKIGSQGSEIVTGQQGFDTVSFDCDKISLGFEITDELMNQSEPDVFASLAEGVGAGVENTLNRKALVELIDNAGESVTADVGAADEETAVQALNSAATEVDLNDYGEPDQAIVHPNFEEAIFDDTNVVYANRSGETEPLRDRLMGDIMGMQRWKASTGSYNNAGETTGLSPDNTFGYDGAGEIGATAFVQDMFNIVIWDDFDMVTKDYEDPIRDLQGTNVRSWMDAVYGQPNAAANIIHS